MLEIVTPLRYNEKKGGELMKNDSFKYPFDTMLDDAFDGNGDGRLDATETMFRDIALDEMEMEAREEREKDSRLSYSDSDNLTDFSQDKSSVSNKTPLAVQAIVPIIVIIILVGSVVLAFSGDVNTFGKLAILTTAVAISLGLLRLAGMF